MKQKILQLMPYFAVVLVITGVWFLKSGYLFFTDFVWGPKIPLDWANQWFLFGVAVKALSFVLPIDFIQKLYVVFCLALVLFGGRKIAGLFLKEKGLVFVASLFALFNPFVYDRVMYGQFGIVGALGLMFFGIGFLLEYLEKRQAKQILLAGISVAFAIQFSPHFIFFIAAFYILIFLPLLFIGKREVAEVVKISVVLVIIAFVLNANWIVGNLTGKLRVGEFVSEGITKQDLVAFQTSGTSGSDALKNVLMMSGFWGKDRFRYRDLTAIKITWGKSFFPLLLLILWGFVAGLRSKEKKHKYLAVGLIITFVFSVILATGIRIPIGREMTNFFFDHLPFYKGLRETQKWVSLMVTVYLIFFSLGLREFFTKRIVQNNAFIMKVFIGAVVVMQAPLLLFGFSGQVKPIQYPADWYKVNELIKSESYNVETKSCDGGILFLPWHMYMSFSWTGKIVANPASVFFECPVVSGTNMERGGIFDNSQSVEGKAVFEWLSRGGATDLLRNEMMNIRYVILAKEIDWKNYQGIDLNPELELIKETETLKVYKVKKEWKTKI